MPTTKNGSAAAEKTAGKPTCSVIACKNAVRARGWCSAHYQRWLVHGDPLGGAYAKGTPAIQKVLDQLALCQCGECSGCLRFTGRHDPQGYGRVSEPGSGHLLPHRVMYEHEHAPIPDGWQVDHVRATGCRHKDCCNTRHLEAVTPEIHRLRTWGTQEAAKAIARLEAENAHLRSLLSLLASVLTGMPTPARPPAREAKALKSPG
jgi:hypothetical protein